MNNNAESAPVSPAAPAVRAGEWVQIHSVVLPAGRRAAQVPPETQAVPLEMWVKGFLTAPARLGEAATVTTLAGRQVTGRLVAVNPAYGHDFAGPVPELLKIGPEVRAILAAAKGQGGPGSGPAPSDQGPEGGEAR